MTFLDYTEDTIKEFDANDLINAFEESVMAFCWHSIHSIPEYEKQAIVAMRLIREELSTRLSQRY